MHNRHDDLAAFIARVRDARFADELACVHCLAPDVRPWGSQRGRRRYLCNNCGRTFSDMTATPAAYSKRLERWDAHLRRMATTMSAREVAQELGVSARTISRWRRRVLEPLAAGRSSLGQGPVELLRWRPYYWKPLLVAVDSGRGALVLPYSYMERSGFNDYMLRRFLRPETTIICRDPVHSPLAKAARRLGLPYQQGETPKAREHAWSLTRWLKRFRGYGPGELPLYLTWHDLLRLRQSPESFSDAVIREWQVLGKEPIQRW
jgi:transposase-like protein